MKSLRLKFDKFIYSTNRKNGIKSFWVSCIIIVISLLIALLICVGIYNKPSLFSDIFYQIFTSPFKKSNLTQFFFPNMAIFMVAASSFVFAYKCGLFNIGISGQMLFGAMIAVMIAHQWIDAPNIIGQIIIILSAMLGAGLIAALIGWLKIQFNMNEVVSSIILNWIIYYAGTYMISATCPKDQGGTFTESLSDNYLLKINGCCGATIPLMILAIFVVIFCFVVFKYLVFGKKVINVGLSYEGSRFAGYSVKKNQILSMLISGMIAGILGAMVYFGKAPGNIPTEVTAKAIPIEGFNGISVGLIAMNNPLGIVPVSLLFGMIETAKSDIAQVCAVDSNITDLMFGIIVYGAAVVSLLYYVKPWQWIMKQVYKHKKIDYDEYAFNVENQINEYLDAISLIKKKCKNLKKGNKDTTWYYPNRILSNLKINLKKIKSKEQKKKLLNRVYLNYLNKRLSKGEE